MNQESRISTHAGNESAGLALSVGQAGLPTRIMLAAVVLMTSLIVIAAGVLLSSRLSGLLLAAVLIEPIGLVGLLASAFILAPHSRFGVWLDRFVPRLRRPATAVLVMLSFWTMGAIILWGAGVLDFRRTAAPRVSACDAAHKPINT